MKRFFKWTLVIIVFATGYTAQALYCIVKGYHWYHLIFQLVGLLMLAPSVLWWKNYFNKLFGNDE